MTARWALYQCTSAQLATVVGPVDVVVTDPPYSPRVHRGMRVAKRYDRSGAGGITDVGVSYAAWGQLEIDRFADAWCPITRRWLCVLCSHDQIPLYADAFARHRRYVFAPVPCVIPGMTVRLTGDGPSVWAITLLVSRPRGMLPRSGTLPGAYVGKRERLLMPGAKPEWLMRDIIADYSRAGDVVCDPCAGSGTTLVAARALGRRSVGSESDPDTHAIAARRLTDG